MKLKKGKYYKMNWYTVKEPEYGYFTILDIDEECYTVRECNPWGGEWIIRYPVYHNIHFQGVIEVPALIGMMGMFKKERK